MRVSQSRIPEIEQAEVSGALRLDTLERAAEALGCRVTYALVPRTSLEHAVQQQALRKAAAQLAAVGVAHNMLIEDQAVTGTDFTEQILDLAAELVDKRGLWAEPTTS
jgi:predicted DNA-binding mobile mystery protein A